MIIRTQQSQQGFSLVELLLTLVLILCLAAASVFTFTTLYRSANLDEGYDRFQSLIRFAQAEAATTGHKVRLQFVSPRSGDNLSATPSSDNSSSTADRAELREIEVTWEADVLNAPGVFQVYTNKTWSEEMVNELVGVEKVQSPNVPSQTASAASLAPSSDATSSNSPETANDATTSSEFPAITFYPDGSCDSAEIVLASRNPDDERRVQVRLGGILGSVSGRTVSGDKNNSETDAVNPEQEFNELFESSQPINSSSSAEVSHASAF